MIKSIDTVRSNEGASDAVSSWDVSARQNGSVMAYVKNSDTEGMYDLYIGQVDGVRTINGSLLFYGYANMISADLSNLIVDEVSNMSSMFGECSNLTTLNLSGWNTSKVLNMSSMFSGCSNLMTLNLDEWNTSSVKNMSYMFNGCGKLQNLNLSSFDMSKVTNTEAMFQNTGIKTLIMPNNYTRIDDFMFNHDTSYIGESFTIPKTVTFVGNSHIFYNFGKDNVFNKFIVENGSTSLKTIDDVLYSYDGTRLISIPRGKTFTNNTYEMPEGVTSLNVMSFSRTQKIDKVILPNSYVISRWYDDTASGDVDPVKGNSLSTAIYVFTSVKEYEVKNDNPNYSSDGGCIYSKDGTELIAVPVHYTGVLNIKNGTTTIGQEAFWKQRRSSIDSITGINIPASVTTIETDQLSTLNYLMSRSTNRVTITIDSGNTAYQIVNNQIVAR
jgi:surface protein